MNEIILFTPLLGFALIGTILSVFNKLKFNNLAIVGGITLISYIVVSIMLKVILIVPIVQVILAFIVFFTLIMTLGKKASGNTLIIFSVLLGVLPFNWWGLLSFGMFIGLLLAIYVKETIQSQNTFKEVSTDITSAIYGSGMGVALPNFDHLEDKKETNKKLFTVMPILFTVVVTVMAIQVVLLFL